MPFLFFLDLKHHLLISRVVIITETDAIPFSPRQKSMRYSGPKRRLERVADNMKIFMKILLKIETILCLVSESHVLYTAALTSRILVYY
jgi:hypothetical protein